MFLIGFVGVSFRIATKRGFYLQMVSFAGAL